MKINLKNARRLEQKMRECADGLISKRNNISSSAYKFSPFDNNPIEDTIKDLQNQISTLFEDTNILNESAYTIRHKINEANNKTEINKLINEQQVNKLNILNLQYLLSDDFLIGKQVDILKNKISNFHEKTAIALTSGDFRINCGIISENTFILYKKQLKETKRKNESIKDDCNSLNITTMITIDSDIIEIAEKYDL